MPIIPRVDESQIISAGSPVAISGTTEDRMMWAEAGELGSAMMKVGAKLAQVEAAATKEADGLQVEIEKSKFASELSDLETYLKSQKVYGDTTSDLNPSKFRDIYVEKARALANRYSGKIPQDRNVRLNFQAEAEKIISKGALNFYAEATKEYAGISVQQIETLTNLEGAKLLNLAGTKNMRDQFTLTTNKIQKFITESQFLTESEKAKLSIGTDKALAKSLIDGYEFKIETSTSSSERQRLMTEALQLMKETPTKKEVVDGVQIEVATPSVARAFGDDERAKYLNRLTSAKYHADSRALQMENLYAIVDAKEEKKIKVQKIQEYATALINAPKENRGAIIQKMKTDSQMDKTKIDDLISLNEKLSDLGEQLKSPKATMFKNEFVDKLLKTDMPENLILSPFDSKDINPYEAIVISNGATNITNELRKDPSLRYRVKDANFVLEQYKTNKNYMFVNNRNKQKLLDAEQKSKEQLYDAMMANPKLDLEKEAQKLYKSNIEPLLQIRKEAPSGQVPDKQNLDKELDNIIAEQQKLKKDGMLTAEKKRELTRRYAEIMKQMNSSGGK